MILLHRITSFFVSALAAGGYYFLIFHPFVEGSSIDRVTALIAMGSVALLSALLLSRLLKWEVTSFSFWIFLSVPMFVIISSFCLYLFLEILALKIILALMVSLALWLYTENLFAFYHLPAAYQAYALEYLSVILYLLSCFFFASSAYGAQMFLQYPIWMLSIAMFWVVILATAGVFWVSKVDSETSMLYAIVGAIMLTEGYVVIGLLPTSFLTNGAAFTVLLYLFFGLSRAHVLEKLTRPVASRYLGIAGAFMVLVFLTARWF
ncbi:MAG: hypothetical protein WC730_01355 [Patescibacteria group bacterium]|jgi:hypothetical protein